MTGQRKSLGPKLAGKIRRLLLEQGIQVVKAPQPKREEAPHGID